MDDDRHFPKSLLTQAHHTVFGPWPGLHHVVHWEDANAIHRFPLADGPNRWAHVPMSGAFCFRTKWENSISVWAHAPIENFQCIDGPYLNMSIVNSENFACSQADPTISISCKLSVMCGDRSHGGVVNGLNLEPEPLHVKWVESTYSNVHTGGPCFRMRWLRGCVCIWNDWIGVGVGDHGDKLGVITGLLRISMGLCLWMKFFLYVYEWRGLANGINDFWYWLKVLKWLLVVKNKANKIKMMNYSLSKWSMKFR